MLQTALNISTTHSLQGPGSKENLSAVLKDLAV